MDRPITAAAVVVVSFVLLLSVAGTAAGAPQVPATRGAPAWTDWSRVRNLAPGDEITVTTTAWAHQEYRMAFADDSLLIVVKPLDRLSPAVLEAMRRLGPNWPGILAGRVVADQQVRISTSGIQENGFQVATIEALRRDAVSEVRRTRKTDAASVLLDIGSIGALMAASASSHYGTWGPDTRAGQYSRDAEVRRYPEPPVRPWPYFNAIGARPANPRDIIYRTSDDIFAPPLDEATWQQLLRGAPPSLRGTGIVK